MERIELFDGYLDNQLSDTERLEFETKLKSDEDFASEFNVYLLAVDGICREAAQDNLEFGIAMKKLTKDQLREIIGKNKSEAMKKLTKEQLREILSKNKSEATSLICAASIDTEVPQERKLKKRNPFRQWIWQGASIAAVIIIAFIAVFRIEKSARDSIDNAIYACSDFNIDLSRGGKEIIDVASLNLDELENRLPTLESFYRNSNNPDELADNGYTLAMAYLRLHNREQASLILTELVDKFDGNTDYKESVSKWKSILNLIK